MMIHHLLRHLPPPLDSVMSWVLLIGVPYADHYLLAANVALLVLAFVQLRAFTRPPPVPAKVLPRRPALQVLFKPDDGNVPVVAGSDASTSTPRMSGTTGSRRTSAAGGRRGAPSFVSSGGARTESSGDSLGFGGFPPTLSGPAARSRKSAGSRPAADRRIFSKLSTLDDLSFEGEGGMDIDGEDDVGRHERIDSADTGVATESPFLHSHDLPDSFAPLLSSSQMELLHHQLTADLIHAVHVEGGVRMREGRHEIPLDKDGSRPQLIFDVAKGGCRITAVAGVGSDGFSSAEDLDVTKPTYSRSRPMVKHAGLVLDPPLPLVNVAPTLIHFPTLFEDNFVPTLRRRQIVRFALDLVVSFSSFLEKILWIIESKCQIHLSKVRVSPLYKGTSASEGNSPQWRLHLAFSGHVLLFNWIPIPFISVTLPTFIIPQPHALLRYLLTAQPLASARLRRENIAEQRVLLSLLNTIETWNIDFKAVATPPALELDLTLPGGLAIAVEMMHGKDLTAGMRRQDGVGGSGTDPSSSFPASIGLQMSTSSNNSLSSWTTYPESVAGAGATGNVQPTAGSRRGPGQAQAQAKQFDANVLVPWSLEASMKGYLEREKLTLNVTKLSARHENATSQNDGAPAMRGGTAVVAPPTSQFTTFGSVVVTKAGPSVVTATERSVSASLLHANTPFSQAQSRMKKSNTHLAALNARTASVTDLDQSVAAILLYPDGITGTTSKAQRMQSLLEYDYAFDVAEDTQIDAVSLSVGASHPMLKGGTMITAVLESLYAFGSLTAREGAVLDPSERRRKRNILRHLPAVDMTAGVQNAFIPEEGLSCSDDGQTKCLPEMQGGRMMIRIVGGILEENPVDMDGDDNEGTVGDGRVVQDDPVRAGPLSSLFVSDGIKVVTDFGISSFALQNESKVNEFPELDIFEGTKLNSLLSGTFTGRISSHLRSQDLSSKLSTTGPNIFNPLEAYEIDFSGSSGFLKIKESSATLGHRRVIFPTETTFEVKVVESIVDMSFEGKTECELSWDFQGSSPILQVTSVGHSPASASHEHKQQAALLISSLRQGRFNFHVSPVGGIAITQAATSRENREGLYDWKFFNALVSPDQSPDRLLEVVHDKNTMRKLLQVTKLINSDLENILSYILKQVWRAKEIFDQEGVSDPGKIIPGHKMARLVSLFLCGDLSEVNNILPIIRRVVSGDGLDVVKVKELVRKHVGAYEEWASEIDRGVRWAAVMLGPMAAPQPYVETVAPPLSELPCHSMRFSGIPSAKELYDQLLDKQQLPLDPSFSNLVARVAPYMSFSQIEYVLKVRSSTDWQPSDLRRLRYVYSVKKKVLDISESYGGLSFLPQSFFVSVFLGEATRASLRAWGGRARKRQQPKQVAPWPATRMSKTSTLSLLRRRRMLAPKPSSQHAISGSGALDQTGDFIMSPAGRVASQSNFAAYQSKQKSMPSDYVSDRDSVDASLAAKEGTGEYELGDSLLGPQDVAILLQAGLTSAMKGSTVVQLNQRMLLDLMASQPRSFAVAVLAEIGTPGGQGSPRGLASALMALLELDQSSFTKIHRLDMHALLESWLPGFKIPRREDYLAGGRWARQSYYDAIFGVATNILEDAESFMALKGHIQRVRHHHEVDPIPLAKELKPADIGIDIDDPSSGLNEMASNAIESARKKISVADQEGSIFVSGMLNEEKATKDCDSYQKIVSLYKDAFEACAEVLKLDKLAFQADWFKCFYRRNYDALMVKSIYDNVIGDVDNVATWLDALRKGSRQKERKTTFNRVINDLETPILEQSAALSGNDPVHTSSPPLPPVFPSPKRDGRIDSITSHDQLTPHSLRADQSDEDTSDSTFFSNAQDHTEQELIDAIIDAVFYDEIERETIREDPLVRLLISNPPGHYNFTIISAMGVVTEGKQGHELAAALSRLKNERGVLSIRADTATARSFEFNASKIIEAVDEAIQLKRPFGLLGYSQGCANILTAESLLNSGTPVQQHTLTSADSGLVCRQLLFSAANGSMHGPCSDTKVQRLIVMCEEFFKYQQGYVSRELVSTVLELLNNMMDSAPFQKFIGGAQSMLTEGSRVFWRDAQHLPHIPTCVLRGVLEEHTTPEALEMISNLLTKQSGSALHDSQVHVYDAVGHPVYTRNRNGQVLKNCDMGGGIQRTHHWSPLHEEVDFLTTQRDIERASFDCAKDRHVFPWADVNARFGIIKYLPKEAVNEQKDF